MYSSSIAGKDIILEIIRNICSNKDYLSQLDGEIGDGDHGVNMNKGFSIAGDLLVHQEHDLSGALKILGKTIFTRIGGAMGPLYGTVFSEMAKASENETEIDKELVNKMLHAAVEGVSGISPAKVGDKTMMDVLVPATEEFQKALDDGDDLTGALIRMKDAAEKGKESTRDMISKLGRSSRLGERSRGILDAGAVSMNLILQSFADGILSRTT
jgi:dihydroxyacetone kinase-like protein